MPQTRNRKTSDKDRQVILELLALGKYSQAEIATMFNISQARVSQIKKAHVSASNPSTEGAENNGV